MFDENPSGDDMGNDPRSEIKEETEYLLKEEKKVYSKLSRLLLEEQELDKLSEKEVDEGMKKKLERRGIRLEKRKNDLECELRGIWKDLRELGTGGRIEEYGGYF